MKCTFRQQTATLHFSAPPFRGLDATYAVNLRLIAKRVVDFLLIELFSLGIIGFYG